MNEIIREVKEKLSVAIRRNSAEGLLFSGGLDSSIIAVLSPGIKTITITLETYGVDSEYAKSLSRFLNIEHYHQMITIEEAIDAIPEVIKILKSFDPAIPNDLVVYFGLKYAWELGINEVLTGDGSDELFAGYSFMENMDKVDEYIKKISKSMRFSSNQIGEFFKIRIVQPFLDKEFIDLSLGISSHLKIKRQNGKVWGKWILRKVFEDVLPKEIIWQEKRPLEFGSGMNRLRKIITSRISDEEFKQKSRFYSVKFMNKEHLYYYEIYRKEVGEVRNAKEGEKKCPGCSAGMQEEAFHCRVCGWVEHIK